MRVHRRAGGVVVACVNIQILLCSIEEKGTNAQVGVDLQGPKREALITFASSLAELDVKERQKACFCVRFDGWRDSVVPCVKGLAHQLKLKAGSLQSL